MSDAESLPRAAVLPLVVPLPAEIDAANAGTVAARLAEALRRGADMVLADMSATTFCDTAGLRVLIRAGRQAAANGTGLWLLSPSPAILRVMKVHGVGGALPVCPRLEEALAAASRRTHPGQAAV